MKNLIFILILMALTVSCKKENINDLDIVKAVIVESNDWCSPYYEYGYSICFFEEMPSDSTFSYCSNQFYSIGDTICFNRCVINPNLTPCDDSVINCN